MVFAILTSFSLLYVQLGLNDKRKPGFAASLHGVSPLRKLVL